MWLRKRVYNRRVLEAFEDLENHFKKTSVLHHVSLQLLEFKRYRAGATLIIRVEVTIHNLKITAYDKGTGTTVFNITGGTAAKKVITERRIKKRDKKGDGVLDFIGIRLNLVLQRVYRHFYVARVKLYIRSYYKRYYFRRLLQRAVWKQVRSNMQYCVLRGHNSLESAKRWKRLRRM